MAYQVGGFGSWPKLSEVLIRAAELGCAIRDLSGLITTPDGPQRVRYLHNPKNGKYVVIEEIGDDEHVAPSMIAYYERRLGLPEGSLWEPKDKMN